MIQIVVTVKTRPGCLEEYLAAFARMAPYVKQEEGCIDYGIYVDSTDSRFDNIVRPDIVVILEKWQSIELLQHHMRHSPALNTFRETVKDFKLESSYWLLSSALQAIAAGEAESI